MDQRKYAIARLKGSAEVQYIIYQCVAMAVIGIIAVVVSLLRNFSSHGAEVVFMAIAVSLGVCLVPFYLFYAIRVFRIFRKPEEYVFCLTALDRPSGGWGRGMMRFTVKVQDRDGIPHEVTTHSVFGVHALVGLRFEDYVNRSAEVAWNPSTGMVVVIG